MMNYFQILSLPQAFRLSGEHIKQAAAPLLRVSHPDSPCGSCEQYGVIEEALRVLQNPASRAEHLCSIRGCLATCPSQATVEREMKLANSLGTCKTDIKRLEAEKRRWTERFAKAWERQRFDECGEISVYLNFIESQIQRCKGQPK